MATSVKLTQVESLPPVGDPYEGEYKLQVTFSNASTDGGDPGGNWDNAFILVKIVSAGDPTQDTYQHICTVGDLESYAPDRATAVANNHDYYRIATWPLYYESIEEMTTAKTVQQTRADYLVTDWENYGGGTWPKTEENTYSAP